MTLDTRPEHTAAEIVIGSMRVPVGPDEGNPFVPRFDPDYRPPGAVLEQMAYAVANDLAVLLIGETGVGKTSLVRYLAASTRHGLRRVNLNGATTVDEFVGRLLLDASGTFWADGVLVDAMRKGDWILLDEINACLPEIAFCLHSLLDDDRMIVLTEHDGSVIRPSPGFRVFATMNPTETGRYGGTRPLNESLLDRFPLAIRIDYLPPEEEVEAVMAQSGNHDRETVQRMVRVATDVRTALRQERMYGSFSTRRLVEWARMSSSFGPDAAAGAAVLAKYSGDDVALVEDVIALYF